MCGVGDYQQDRPYSGDGTGDDSHELAIDRLPLYYARNVLQHLCLTGTGNPNVLSRKSLDTRRFQVGSMAGNRGGMLLIEAPQRTLLVKAEGAQSCLSPVPHSRIQIAGDRVVGDANKFAYDDDSRPHWLDE
jgi:hypothetical protein